MLSSGPVGLVQLNLAASGSARSWLEKLDMISRCGSDHGSSQMVGSAESPSGCSVYNLFAGQWLGD